MTAQNAITSVKNSAYAMEYPLNKNNMVPQWLIIYIRNSCPPYTHLRSPLEVTPRKYATEEMYRSFSTHRHPRQQCKNGSMSTECLIGVFPGHSVRIYSLPVVQFFVLTVIWSRMLPVSRTSGVTVISSIFISHTSLHRRPMLSPTTMIA